jgi:5-methylcytosine-specific restriction protein A
LTRFPGALFDAHGYVFFSTEVEYLRCPQLQFGKRVNVPGGISSIQSYVRVAARFRAPDEGMENEQHLEGREVLMLHRRKERNRQAIERKKKRVLLATGKLACEVCDFDFAITYGPIGHGFAECHHRVPMSGLSGEYRLRLSDLAIVCANCHRILHRRPWRTIPQLRNLVLRRRRAGASAIE